MKKLLLATVMTVLAIAMCIAFSACAEEEHKHKLTVTEATEPKCNVEGNVEYWTCSGCKKSFLDEKGTLEAKKQSDIVLEMTECSYRGCVCRWCGDGTHSLKFIYGIDSFCDTAGRVEHWECITCELVFADSEAKTEFESVVILPTHRGGTEIRNKLAPTEESEGYTGDTCCITCGAVLELGSAIEKLDHTHVLTYYPKRLEGCTFDGNVEYWACDVCNKKYSDEETVTEIKDTVVKGSHIMSKTEAKEATCLVQGNTEYWSCARCSGYFADENGKTAIPKKTSVVINYKNCSFVNERCIWCKKVDQWCNPSLTVVEDMYLVVTGLDSYSGTDIVIEKSYGGLPVRVIGDGAFASYKDITSVSIPEGVVLIEKNAFADCTSLVSVTLPSTLSTIEDGAFAGCYKLFEVVNRSKLGIKAGRSSNGMVAYYAKTVHNGVTNIKRANEYLFCALGGNTYMLGYTGIDKSLVLPQSYNGASYKIYKYAFYGMTDIYSVTLPQKLIGIEDNAFNGCVRLVEVINNSDIKLNVGDVSNGWVAFNALEVHEGESRISSYNGYVYYKLGSQIYVLGYEGSDTVLTLPRSIEGSSYKVIARAFADMKEITSVSTGGATELGAMAFYGCTSLKRVELGYQLESLGASVFQGCDSLESVTLNGIVKNVGPNVFFMCPKLKNKPF